MDKHYQSYYAGRHDLVVRDTAGRFELVAKNENTLIIGLLGTLTAKSAVNNYFFVKHFASFYKENVFVESVEVINKTDVENFDGEIRPLPLNNFNGGFLRINTVPKKYGSEPTRYECLQGES